jgi:CubicO group peptidase (beta-lactamase class C family)
VGSIPTLATISPWKSKVFSRRVVFAALVTLAACGLPRTAQHSSAAPDPTAVTSITGRPDTADLAREIPHLLRVSGIPGLSMAVVQNGRVVWAGAFGTLNDSAQTPLNPGTLFEAASLSKPVFAYLVLRLADRGEFDLDRPLYEMLEYPRLAHDERYKRITARIVLSHGTGLPNWGGEKLTLRFDPGTDYGYSGEGFVFLQKTVERVTGRSLDELARREVFEPLGMTRSSYVWQERFADNAAYAKNWLWQVAPANRYTEAEANAAAGDRSAQAIHSRLSDVRRRPSRARPRVGVGRRPAGGDRLVPAGACAEH